MIQDICYFLRCVQTTKARNHNRRSQFKEPDAITTSVLPPRRGSARRLRGFVLTTTLRISGVERFPGNSSPFKDSVFVFLFGRLFLRACSHDLRFSPLSFLRSGVLQLFLFTFVSVFVFISFLPLPLQSLFMLAAFWSFLHSKKPFRTPTPYFQPPGEFPMSDKRCNLQL